MSWVSLMLDCLCGGTDVTPGGGSCWGSGHLARARLPGDTLDAPEQEDGPHACLCTPHPVRQHHGPRPERANTRPTSMTRGSAGPTNSTARGKPHGGRHACHVRHAAATPLSLSLARARTLRREDGHQRRHQLHHLLVLLPRQLPLPVRQRPVARAGEEGRVTVGGPRRRPPWDPAIDVPALRDAYPWAPWRGRSPAAGRARGLSAPCGVAPRPPR